MGRVSDNAPDFVDLGAVVLRDLTNRHAVLYPRSDAGELRPRDLDVDCGSGAAAALTSSSLFAGPAIICSTRGLRSVGDGGAFWGTAGLVTGGFDVNSASAAWRAHLTVMFSDLVGSTLLSTRYDPEDLREIVGAYHSCVADTVVRFDGFVAKYMGDGVLVIRLSECA